MKLNEIYFAITSVFWVVLTVVVLLGAMKLSLKIMFALSAVLFVYESYQSTLKLKRRRTTKCYSIFNTKRQS